MGIFGGKKNPHSGPIDSVIGKGAKIRGEFSSSGSISIDGEFEGKLSSKGEIILSPSSKVVGEIQTSSAIIAGKVTGNIIASKVLEIDRSARVHGDLVGGKIIIEDGATYRGKVRVEGEGSKEEPPVEEEASALEPHLDKKKIAQPQMF